jgi:hypothetical protein
VIRFFLSIAEMGELMSRPLSFFDTDDRLRSLSEAGDPLELGARGAFGAA